MKRNETVHVNEIVWTQKKKGEAFTPPLLLPLRKSLLLLCSLLLLGLLLGGLFLSSFFLRHYSSPPLFMD